MYFLTSLPVRVYFGLRIISFITKDDFVLTNTVSQSYIYHGVEYLFSPIFQNYSRVEWLRDNKVMHVLGYVFLCSIDRTRILICPFSLIGSESLVYCVESLTIYPGGALGYLGGRIRSLSKLKNTPKALISDQKNTLILVKTLTFSTK